jgi:carbon storage regulator
MMLVLSRRESQRIRLGESIVLTIVRVNGDRVRVGIEAPADIRVRRAELEPEAQPSDEPRKAAG